MCIAWVVEFHWEYKAICTHNCENNLKPKRASLVHHGFSWSKDNGFEDEDNEHQDLVLISLDSKNRIQT